MLSNKPSKRSLLYPVRVARCVVKERLQAWLRDPYNTRSVSKFLQESDFLEAVSKPHRELLSTGQPIKKISMRFILTTRFQEQDLRLTLVSFTRVSTDTRGSAKKKYVGRPFVIITT